MPNLSDVNPELLRVVIADQWDRGMDMFGGRPAKRPVRLIGTRSRQETKSDRSAVRALVNKGLLKSGRDCQFAALVLQHSESSADVRLAHLLAVTAALKGQPSAKWLAAAALDRYLWDTQQPQVFGTQFKQVPGSENKWTMEPYDREALPDSVRADWCVKPLSEQAAVLAALGKGQGAGSTGTAECK